MKILFIFVVIGIACVDVRSTKLIPITTNTPLKEMEYFSVSAK